MDTSSESYGSLLIPVIVNKLPKELQLVISRKLEKGKWDVEQFMKEFKTELEARERCCMINNTHPTMKKDGTSQNKRKITIYILHFVYWQRPIIYT